ncbi:MAG TPA: hypothetical protein ENJ09_12265, partial [Planctomycetes bacterium]|nr:hypothetical protein [Planctomycetota bacterium]
MFDSRAVLNLLSVPHNILIPRGEATWGDRIGWFFTNLLGSVVVLAVGVGIALGLRALARVCLRISGCEAKLAELLCRVLFAACVALALVAAVGKWGVSGYWFGSAITWLLGVFTLVVAVACIGPARNFMAGVAIRSGKRLRDGDVLEKDGA